MPAPTSRLAYTDCFSVYDQALEADRGVRIKFVEYGDAMNYRLRLHYARSLDRKDNKQIYEPGDKLYGRSVYDVIRVVIKNIEGAFYLYLEKMDGSNLEVEPIEDEPVPEMAEAMPVPKIDRRV